MRKLNNYLLCSFISILLFFAAAGAEASLIIKNAVLNPDSYHRILEKNDVYGKICSEVRKHYESEYNATGIPADVFMDVFTEQAVKELADSYLDSAFGYISGRDSELKTEPSEALRDSLKKSVEGFFDEYAASAGYKKDEAYYSKTESVYNDAVSYIKDAADVFQFSGINKAGYLSAARKVYSYTGKLCGLTCTAAGVLIVLIFLLNLRKFSGAFYWISISAGSVSSLLLAAGLYFKNSGYFNRFTIKMPSVFSAVTGSCFEFTDIVIYTNAALFAAGVVLMLLYVIFGKIKEEK